VDGGGAEGELARLGVEFVDEGPGEVDGPCAEGDGEQPHDVDGQRGSLPGEAFQGGVVNDEVNVAAIGCNLAGGDVGVEVAYWGHCIRAGTVAGVNPKGQRGPDGVVEGGLAGFLAPRPAGGTRCEGLHRQRPGAGDVFDHRVVPQLVGRLEDGDQAAVQDAEKGEGRQNDE